MSSHKSVKQYIEEIEPYHDAFLKLAGKPQKLSVVDNNLFWTQGKQQELFTIPLDGIGKCTAKRVIAEAANVTEKNKTLTKEEELLRERMRSVVTGISSYRVRPGDGAVFFLSGIDLFVYYQHGPRAGAPPLRVFAYMSERDQQHFAALGGKPNMCIQHIKTSSDARETSAAAALNSFTFVNSDNLYRATITEHPENDEAPLEVLITQITTIGDPLHPCGLADYVTQEEFDRYTGHYANERYVVFSYTDSSMLREVALLSGKSSSDGGGDEDMEGGLERMPYARVGDPNPRTVIVVHDQTDGTLRLVPPAAITQHAPWAEYYPRFGFKDASTVYLSVLSRTQEELMTLTCAIHDLERITEADLQALYLPDAKTRDGCAHDKNMSLPVLQVECYQRIPWAWTEVFPGSPIQREHALDLRLAHAHEDPTAHLHIFARRAGGTRKDAWTPLTQGAWNVKPGTVVCAEGHVAFLANAEERLSQALYVAALPDPSQPLASHKACDAGDLVRLSSLDEHVYSFIAHDNYVFFVASTRRQPPSMFMTTIPSKDNRTAAKRTQVSLKSWLADSDDAPVEVENHSSSIRCLGLPVVLPTVVTVTNRRGVPLSANVFATPVPQASSSEGGSPLALFVYGGPHVQLVSAHDFDASCKAAVQVLLHHGISVAVVDNQMSNANGLRDLSICKKNMGAFETDDYIDVVSALCDRSANLGLPQSFRVDPKRVGIFGWSYGGYATLLAMSQAPQTFKMGFAGAPVGDWRLYDTGYTERYMGTLNEDCHGKQVCNKAYTNSCIAHFASGFPEELHRLHIAHGLLDENVHFVHSCHVINALITNNKPYNLLLYPGERHGLRQKKQSRLHHDALQIKTFVEHL